MTTSNIVLGVLALICYVILARWLWKPPVELPEEKQRRIDKFMSGDDDIEIVKKEKRS